MNKTYYLNGEAFTFETQEELDAWLAENPGASETNDKVSFKPNIFENTESSTGSAATAAAISNKNTVSTDNVEESTEEFDYFEDYRGIDNFGGIEQTPGYKKTNYKRQTGRFDKLEYKPYQDVPFDEIQLPTNFPQGMYDDAYAKQQEIDLEKNKKLLDEIFFQDWGTNDASEVRAKLYGRSLFIEDLGGRQPFQPPASPSGHKLDMGYRYWSNSNKREEDRNTYIRLKSDEQKIKFNSKFELKEDANKAIIAAGDNYISIEDMDIVELERNGEKAKADELRKERGYVKLLNEDGTLKNYIPKKVEEEASNIGTSNDESVLNEMRAEKFYNLMASINLANDNKDAGRNLKTLGDVGIFGKLKASDAIPGRSKNMYDVMDIIANISESGELLAELQKLPSKTATSRQFNKALEEFVTINRAIEINADLRLIDEQGFFEEIFMSETNDQVVETFSNMMEANGYQIDDETIKRAGSDWGGEGGLNIGGTEYELRDMLEGGRDVATHLVPLAASVYLTKKLPMGFGKKAKNLGKLLDQKVNVLGRFVKNAGPQSRIFRNVVDLSLGGVKETIVLGLADMPAENLFGADPFVYNSKTGEFSPTFPFALGFGNVAAGKILNKLNTTKNIFTPMLAAINRSKTAQSLLEMNIGATTGTATMFFAEEVVNLTNFNDLGYESQEDMKQGEGFKNLVETYIGMLMFQSISPSMKQNSLSKLATGMKNDIMRASTGLSSRTRTAAKSFGVKTNKKGEFNLQDLNNKKAEQLFNLSKLEKDKSIEGFEAEFNKKRQKIENEYDQLVFHNELKLAKQLAKKEGKYKEYLVNTFDIFNKMNSGQQTTAKDVDRIAALSEVELSFLKKRFQVSENSDFGNMLSEKHNVYKSIVKLVKEQRLHRVSPEAREVQIKEYLNQAEVLGKIENLKTAIETQPHLKNVNKQKIKELQEKLDLSTENIIKNEKLYDKILKDKFKTEVEFSKLMAREIGAGFNLLSESQYNKLEGVQKGSEGSYNRVKNQIYINKDAALKARQLGTPLHEITHAILKNSLKETFVEDGVEKTRVSKEGMVKINKFLDLLNSKERKLVEERMESEYKFEKDSEGNFITKPNGDRIVRPKNEYYEEYLTAFGDVLKNKEVAESPGLTARLKTYFEPIFRQAGFAKLDVSTNSGKGLYNMIKAIQKSSETGVVNKDVLNVLKTSKNVTGKNIAESRTVTKEMAETSSKVDKLYNEKGLEGYNEIIDIIKGKDAQGRQVSKDFVKFYTEIYREHPGYESKKDLLYDAMANDPIYGVLGSIVKYNPAKGTTMAEHILGRLKQGKHIDIANKILGKDAQRQFTKKLDAAEVKELESKQLTAEELTDINLAKEKIQQAPNFRKSIVKGEEKGINQELIDRVETAVVKTFGTKLPLPNTKGFEKNLENNFKTELKKPIADLMGKGPEYEIFLRDNFDQIMKFVDNRFFVQIERLSKPKDRIFTEVEIESMSVKETDKAISEGRVPKNTSRTAGNALYKFKKPTPAEFIKFYIGSGLGSTKGTRKDRLAEVIGIELAKDMTSQVLLKPEVIAKVKNISILELERSIEGTGKDSQKVIEAREMMFDTYLERVASEIGRDPNLMFSVTEIKRDARELKKILKQTDVREVFDINKKTSIIKRKDGTEYNPEAVKIVFDHWQIGNLTDAVRQSQGKGNLGYNYEPYLQAQSVGKITRLKEKGIQITGGTGEKSIYYPPQGNWKGGTVQQADMVAKWWNNSQMWELKFGKARGSRNPAGFVNYTKGTITRSKKRTDSKEEALVVEAMQKAIKNGAKEVEAILREQNILKPGEDFTSQTKIPNEVHKLLSGRGNAKAKLADNSVIVNGKFVEVDYLNKGVFNFQMGGKGAFVLGEPSVNNRIAMEAGATRLEGNFELKARIYATSYKFKGTDITAGYTYKLSAEALLSPKNITSKSTLDLDSPGAWKKMANTTAAKKMKQAYIAEQTALKVNNAKNKEVGLPASKTNKEAIENAKTFDKALTKGAEFKKKARGMSTFDFDETVGISENFVFATKGKQKKKIASNEWPFVGDKLLAEGWKMDFTDFNKVTKGKPGPLMQKLKNQIKKYGPENVFILTARAPESQKAIHDYLKTEGVEIPFKNITGLGNSTGEAKAMWMLKKFSEGYNDMYFVDDALPNVKAVKDVLSQLDIKSSVQQAYMSSKTTLNEKVNNIMDHSLGIEVNKTFSKAEAKVRGKDIKRRRVFMRDSAADLELLIEPLYGKGKKGNENKKWFKKEFIMPFETGIRDYNVARQSAKNDYMSLRKQNKDVVKQISKEVEGTSFTNDMAMRVYLWNKAGYKIPDLAKSTETKLVEHIKKNPSLQAYAERFATITKQEKGLKEPGENWWGETMAGEVTNIDRGVSRKQYLQQFIDVKNQIFSEQNLNKMESKLGTRWRENITDMFDRMQTGRTRSLKLDRGSAAMMNYLNGGIGTIMNFNTRSAALQTISTLNFLNMRENNPISAGRAMANVPQFAKDFLYIMNSPMLKQRRDGLAINVTEAEIASAAASSPNMIQGVISKVLKVGYTPTKLADSFAISFGGATFYRNRIKMYEKQGMKTKDAEKQSFLDFQVLAERTQQSSRADLLSRQQTSLIGRIILPFANTPMQMNRAGMKDILDVAKGRTRGVRNISEAMGRITYYMGAQVAMFAGLQSALFGMLYNDDDVSEEKIASTKAYTLQSTMDSMLRGFGVQGALISTFKNATLEFLKQNAKTPFKADYTEVAEDLLNLSPPIGSKFGMLDAAGDRLKYNKKTPFKFELGNPKLEASLMTIQALSNAPVYAPYQNANNLKHALSDQYETWQRVLMAGGWTTFNVGIELEKKKAPRLKRKKFEDINIHDF